MEKARRLLEELTRLVPPGPGQRHNITIADNWLVVTLMLGAKYVPILLREVEFGKLAAELADEICRAAKPEIDGRADLPAATAKPVIRFFCESCGQHQPVEIEPLTADELNRPMAWGDIVCRKCHFVIATMSVDEAGAGTYQIVKVN